MSIASSRVMSYGPHGPTHPFTLSIDAFQNHVDDLVNRPAAKPRIRVRREVGGKRGWPEGVAALKRSGEIERYLGTIGRVPRCDNQCSSSRSPRGSVLARPLEQGARAYPLDSAVKSAAGRLPRGGATPA